MDFEKAEWSFSFLLLPLQMDNVIRKWPRV